MFVFWTVPSILIKNNDKYVTNCEENPIDKTLKPIWIQALNHEPALKLHSKGALSVGAHHRVVSMVPIQEEIPKESGSKKIKQLTKLRDMSPSRMGLLVVLLVFSLKFIN